MQGQPLRHLEGSFHLYGTAFRWTREDAAAGSRHGAIHLVRRSSPLPEDQVHWLFPGADDIPWLGRSGSDYAYRFDGVTDFLLPRNGSTLHIFAQPQVDPETLNFVLARGMIPRLLQLRGTVCLHASAVGAGDGVVGFLGASGKGKSTVAAALVARGFPLVSDDVLPLQVEEGEQGLLAGPGLLELRLWSFSARLAGVSEQMGLSGGNDIKGRWVPEADQSRSDTRPLTGLYLLHPRGRSSRKAAATTRPLSTREVFFTTLEQSFWIAKDETRPFARNLTCFALLARSVPTRRLYFSLTRDGLQDVAQLVRRETLGDG